MHRKRITYIILGIGLLGIIGGIFGTNFLIQSDYSTNSELPYAAEISNSTIAYPQDVERMVDSFDVSVNLSSSYPDADFVEMTISLNNGTDTNYTLSEVSDVWSHSMYFDALAPLGEHSFRIFIYDGGSLEDTSSVRPFEIKNSPPRIGIDISNTIIHRDETLFFNLTPTDPEDAFGDLVWSWEILNQVQSLNSSSGLQKITNLSHYFSTNSDLGEYSLKGVILDQDGASTTNIVNFTVENNIPNITAYFVTYPSVQNQILRSTDHFNLKVNVSDIEVLPDAVDLRVMLYGPGDTEIERSGRMVRTHPSWHFDGNISVPTSVPIGEYLCEVTAYETINDFEYNLSQYFEFTVLNNIPNASEITFTINKQIPTDFGIRIKEFERITFDVNISDVDPEGIDIIQIQIIPSIGNEMLFSFAHNGSETLSLTIYAKDLEYGQWITWIWVIDSDGERVQSDISYSFDIVPHRFPKVLPWIMLVIGAVVAFGVSMAFLGTRYLRLRRDFDNLLSRSGDYKKSDGKSKKPAPKAKKVSETTEKQSESTTTTKSKKKSSTKKHKLFREIKKK